MRKLVRLATGLALALWFGAAHAMPITYDFNFDDGGGNTLMGSITTNGKIGDILDTDIVAWEWTASSDPSFSIVGTEIQPELGISSFNPPGQLVLSDATLTSAVYDGTNGSVNVVFTQGTFAVAFQRDLGVLWADLRDSPNRRLDPINFFVGTARQTSPAPEPATALLVGLSLAGIGFVGRKRRRQSFDQAAVA